MTITASQCESYSDRNRPVISSERHRKTLCGMTQNPKQELLRQGKKLFFSLGFPSMISVAALFHKTLRDQVPSTPSLWLSPLLLEGTTLPGGRMEEEMKRQRARSSALLKRVPGNMPLLSTCHWLEFCHMTHGAAMEAGKCSFSLDHLLS